MHTSNVSPSELRCMIRSGNYDKPTAGLCPGKTQVNLICVPGEYSQRFLNFCHLNIKPLPLLEHLNNGSHTPAVMADGADIRTDCPAYMLVESGKRRKVKNLLPYWRDDMASFLVGCSFTFETALIRAKIPVRHIDEGKNVPMYLTDIDLAPVPPFKGKMVVSMRPIPENLVDPAVSTTSRYPAVHGGPVHIGNPLTIGIRDIKRPDFGDAVTVYPGEVPVFWACGVSGLSAVISSGIFFAATHAPGCMLVTDRNDDDYLVK